MLTERISLAKQEVQNESIPGLLSFTVHCEGHFPLLDCPINQLSAGRGSFLVPVTTSDCLGGNTSRMSSSPRLIIIRTRAEKKKKTSQQNAGVVLNSKDVCIIQTFDYTVKFHLCSETILAQTSIICFLKSDDVYQPTAQRSMCTRKCWQWPCVCIRDCNSLPTTWLFTEEFFILFACKKILFYWK